MRIIRTDELTPETPLSTNENDWSYNGIDCMITLEIWEKTSQYLDNMTAGTYQFSRDLQGPILEMTTRGMLIDQVRRQEVLALYKSQMKEVEAQLLTLIHDGIGIKGTFNWRSPAQLKSLFYGVLDLRPIRKRNANGEYTPTTDREALEKLSSNFFAEPICIRLLFLRDLEKKRQFLETEVDPDGRIRTNFNIAGTNTGRLASAMSDFGTGGNLQNVDRELRSVFIADPGMKFCNVDLEQADARNYGAICWNNFVESHGEAFAGAYLNACEGGDLHTIVCRSAWTGLDWGDDPKGFRAVADRIAYRQSSYRDLAKKLGHGCLTGDHEVLTRNGWTKISNMPSEILTWSRGKSEFAKVKNWTHHNYSGLMQHFYSNAINLYMTHDHRVPYLKDVEIIFCSVTLFRSQLHLLKYQ